MLHQDCQPETLPGIHEFRAMTEWPENFPPFRSGSAGVGRRDLGMAEAAGAPCGAVQAMNRGMSSPGIITETDDTLGLVPQNSSELNRELGDDLGVPPVISECPGLRGCACIRMRPSHW